MAFETRRWCAMQHIRMQRLGGPALSKCGDMLHPGQIRSSLADVNARAPGVVLLLWHVVALVGTWLACSVAVIKLAPRPAALVRMLEWLGVALCVCA